MPTIDVTSSDIGGEQRRETQLDVIAAVLSLGLLTAVVLLGYAAVIQGGPLEASEALSTNPVRVLLVGFVLMVMLYLWDQRQRLRIEVRRKAEELDRAVKWLALSHGAATILAERGTSVGLEDVLRQIASLLDASAAAVVSSEVRHLHIKDSIDRGDVDRLFMHAAIEAVGHPEPLRVTPFGADDGETAAIPLRVHGELRSVLCVWRREGVFADEEVDALGLAGRMIELAIENEESIAQARTQLEGTLAVLQHLGTERSRDYAKHAEAVSSLACRVGHELGLSSRELDTLRIAGMLHDIGLLSLPAAAARCSTVDMTLEERLIYDQHARVGAEIAEAANFGADVQDAIMCHHMSLREIKRHCAPNQSPSMPVLVLAACEAFQGVCVPDADEAERENVALVHIRAHAGTTYDSTVARALMAVVDSRRRRGLTLAAQALELEPQHSLLVDAFGESQPVGLVSGSRV